MRPPQNTATFFRPLFTITMLQVNDKRVGCLGHDRSQDQCRLNLDNVTHLQASSHDRVESPAWVVTYETAKRSQHPKVVT